MQRTGLVTAILVSWRFGWETGCWDERLAATMAGSEAADMVAGMVAPRDYSKFSSLIG